MVKTAQTFEFTDISDITFLKLINKYKSENIKISLYQNFRFDSGSSPVEGSKVIKINNNKKLYKNQLSTIQ